jgi:branched-chain amino acid transport system ATP-binding protein
MPNEPLLEVSGIECGYGQIQVLWGVEIDVYERETVVLLGANGAGKTTLLKTILGLVPAWGGRVLFRGADITHLRTDLRVRRGMVYMSETAVFAGLTIEENIRIGGQFLAKAALRARAEELYAVFPALAERRGELAASLSGGQRKMLGIAKALAGQPQLLVMDEPSAGLSPLFVKEVIRILAQFRGQGVTLLIAEQNVKFLELADRAYSLEGGRIGFAGTVAEIYQNDELRRAYFGLR